MSIDHNEVKKNLEDIEVRVINEETEDSFILDDKFMKYDDVCIFFNKNISFFKYDKISDILLFVRENSFPKCYVLSDKYNKDEKAIDDPDRLKYIFYTKEEFYEWFEKNKEDIIS